MSQQDDFFVTQEDVVFGHLAEKARWTLCSLASFRGSLVSSITDSVTDCAHESPPLSDHVMWAKQARSDTEDGELSKPAR